MKKSLCKRYYAVLLPLLLIMLGSCQKNAKDAPGSGQNDQKGSLAAKEFKDFVQVNLLADDDKFKAKYKDPGFVNPWGIGCAESGPMMIPVSGSGTSKFITLDGLMDDLAVNIPPRFGSSGQSHPTGVACNTSQEFILPNGNPAKFIFASDDGTVSGWNVGPNAIRMINNTGTESYLGVAIAAVGEHSFIYVANFAQGRIDVYDGNWLPVKMPVSASFVDPDLPVGYSPFNIQMIDSKLFVMYAKRNNETGKEEKGPGKGFINIFNPDGTLFKKFASQGKLNAPWGIAKAPTKFWGSTSQLADVFLVGNFGNGQINVYDVNGNFVSTLHSRGKAVEIDGLWGLAFPPATGFNSTFLYFTAGPDDETHGLFGYIKNLYLN